MLLKRWTWTETKNCVDVWGTSGDSKAFLARLAQLAQLATGRSYTVLQQCWGPPDEACRYRIRRIHTLDLSVIELSKCSREEGHAAIRGEGENDPPMSESGVPLMDFRKEKNEEIEAAATVPVPATMKERGSVQTGSM